jgi:tetratricopeptide (TPR) repeat protein
MKKIVLLLIFFAVHPILFAQKSTGRMLFVIDSIPVFYDLHPLNDLWEEDIATRIAIKNEQGLKLTGASDIDSITYIFTKAWVSRPDSIKKLPSLKQMEMKDSKWHFHGTPYTGKYVDYYFSGNKSAEGWLLNGKQEGEEILYFQLGQHAKISHYSNGKLKGFCMVYYKNGNIQSRGTYREEWNWIGESYFPNGQIESRGTAPDSAGNYANIDYYSSGKIKRLLNFYRNGSIVQDSAFQKSTLVFKKIEQMKKAANKKEAKKVVAAVIELDSANTDVYGSLGIFMFEHKYFNDAIAAFDKALAIEPYQSYLLMHRALARINKNGPERKWVKPANSETLVLTPFDIKNVPATLRVKICDDLERAAALRTIFANSFDFLLLENAKKYCDIDLRR